MTVKEAHTKILANAVKIANTAVTEDADLEMQGNIFVAAATISSPLCMKMEDMMVFGSNAQYIPTLRKVAAEAVYKALLTTEVDDKNLLAALIVGHAHQQTSYFDQFNAAS